MKDPSRNTQAQKKTFCEKGSVACRDRRELNPSRHATELLERPSCRQSPACRERHTIQPSRHATACLLERRATALLLACRAGGSFWPSRHATAVLASIFVPNDLKVCSMAILLCYLRIVGVLLWRIASFIFNIANDPSAVDGRRRREAAVLKNDHSEEGSTTTRTILACSWFENF